MTRSLKQKQRKHTIARARRGLRLEKLEARITLNAEAHILLLPLDEGVGTVAEDLSAEDNDGTLVNGANFENSTGDGSNSAVR